MPEIRVQKGAFMPTHIEIARERELLAELGLSPVKHWPPRCTWYRSDGSVAGNMPCDPYSRLLYMGRGLRPDVGGKPNGTGQATLVNAVVRFYVGAYGLGRYG